MERNLITSSCVDWFSRDPTTHRFQRVLERGEPDGIIHQIDLLIDDPKGRFDVRQILIKVSKDLQPASAYSHYYEESMRKNIQAKCSMDVVHYLFDADLYGQIHWGLYQIVKGLLPDREYIPFVMVCVAPWKHWPLVRKLLLELDYDKELSKAYDFLERRRIQCTRGSNFAMAGLSNSKRKTLC